MAKKKPATFEDLEPEERVEEQGHGDLVSDRPRSPTFQDLKNEVSDEPDFFPRLDLGGKEKMVRVDVEFLQAEPRACEFKDKFRKGAKTPGIVINVKVLTGPEAGSFRSIMTRLDHGNSLARALAKLAQRVGNLQGVEARVEGRAYIHPDHGPSKGYTIIELPQTAVGEPPIPGEDPKDPDP